MAKHKVKPEPQKRSIMLADKSVWDDLCVSGYTSLDKNPEIMTSCRIYADLISSMTIHLMANTERGDIRIQNELSKKVDIYPNRWMTRKTWMESIIMTLVLYGNGNSVVIPHTERGLLSDLQPVPASDVGFVPERDGYKIRVNEKTLDPDDVLHFVLNPDPYFPWMGRGITCNLRDIAQNLKQAAATEKGFMESKWKPSLIVKVDALADEFSSPKGRKKLLDSYIETTGAGEPWLIPAEQFSVEQVRPLSLADLAIADNVKLNRQAVASIIGVPAFSLGVGQFNAAEWNHFISTRIRPMAREIEQEMTRKLLTSEKMYWRFNIASLYSYDLPALEKVYADLYVRGIATGNEVRDRMGMEPKDGLDELVILENYIPLDRIGDQLKLKDGENNG